LATSTDRNFVDSCRIRDVFLVLFVYFVLLLGLLRIESAIFGPEAVSEDTRNPRALLIEDIFDAFVLTSLPVLFVLRVYRSDLSRIGIVFRGFIRNVCLGSAAGLLLWLTVILCDLIIRNYFVEIRPHPYIAILQSPDRFLMRAAILLSILVLAPVSEEVFFRGFAYTILKHKLGGLFGNIISSVLFAGVHLEPSRAVQVLIVGIALAALFELAKSLVVPIAAHAAMNVLFVSTGLP
jgi:hypothetical protein